MNTEQLGNMDKLFRMFQLEANFQGVNGNVSAGLFGILYFCLPWNLNNGSLCIVSYDLVF